MKNQLFQKETIFAKKGKPIALLFDEKSAISKGGNFCEKGKPIALLLLKNHLYRKEPIFAEKVGL